MPFNIQTFLNYLLIILALICGLVAGAIASRLMALSLGPPQQPVAISDTITATVDQPEEEDLQVILRRSLFDVAGVGSRLEGLSLTSTAPVTDGEEEMEASPRRTSVDLDKYILLGTVVAGDFSLAVIKSGSEVEVYGIDAEVEPGVRISQIERKLVVLLADGRSYELRLEELLQDAQQGGNRKAAAPRPAPRSPASGGSAVNFDGGVEEVGEGRYRVDRGMVEQARANMGALLQSARMIPHLENGQTTGFRLVGMQRGSLLEQLGLKLGDVVMEINRIRLDSPEKALQIFQQVREANNISIGLVRDGQPQTFEYSLD